MKVLFIDTVHPFLQEKLTEAGYHCVDGTQWSADEIDNAIGDFQGIVIRSRVQLDKIRLQKATNLQFIGRAGSGMENIDVTYCESKGIKCYNAPEANCNAVAEHCMGMILSLFNRLHLADLEVRNGVWDRHGNRGLELGHRTVGIIGYGFNGTATAKAMAGLGTKILAYDKYKKVTSEGNIYESNWEEIKREADVISFHVPYNEETHYYFNDVLVASMQRPFYLINTSRGAVVDTAALVRGLESGKVLGACLDVLEYEKSSFKTLHASSENVELNYLTNSDKVLLSPHVAGWTQESLYLLSEVLAKKILA